MAKKKGIGSPRLIHSANDTGRDFISENFINVTKDYSEAFHKLGYGRMFKNFGLGNNDLITMSNEFGYGLLHGLSKEESLLNGLNKVRDHWQDRVDGKSLTGVDFSKDQKAEAQRLLNVTKGTYINYSEKADRVKAKRGRYNQLKEKYRTSPTQDDRIKENKWLLKSSKKSVDRHRQKRAPGKNSRRGSKYTYAMERAGEKKRAAHAASQSKAALKANKQKRVKAKWNGINGKFGKIAGAIGSLIGSIGEKSKSILKKESFAKKHPLKPRNFDEERLDRKRHRIVQRKPFAKTHPLKSRDFDKERLDRKAAREQQRIKIESPSTSPKSGEPVKQEAVQVKSEPEPQTPTSETKAEEVAVPVDSGKSVQQGAVETNAASAAEKVETAGEQAAVPVKSEESVQANTPEPTPTTPKAEETTQGPIAQAQEASSTPTGNQQNAGATQGSAQTNNQEAAGVTQGGGTTSNQEVAGASSGSSDDSYDAKLKALRKKGRASEYAADRIDQERKQVIDMINDGNYKDAASAMGYSGEYTAEHADKLRQAAEKHAMDAVNEGAGIMDYVNAYHVPGAIGGAAILAGTGSALMKDNGRKSNEQLYSSPF